MGFFVVKHRRNGILLREHVLPNGISFAGSTDILNVAFRGTSPPSKFYIGLATDVVSTPFPEDTLATVAWTEAEDQYTPDTRPEIVFSDDSDVGSFVNYLPLVEDRPVVVIEESVDIGYIFLTDSPTKGDTSSLLIASAFSFISAKPGDELELNYVFSLRTSGSTNRFTNEGGHYVLGAYLRGESALTTFYHGLIETQNPVFDDDDTLMSHVGWVEDTSSARPAVTFNAPTTQRRISNFTFHYTEDGDTHILSTSSVRASLTGNMEVYGEFIATTANNSGLLIFLSEFDDNGRIIEYVDGSITTAIRLSLQNDF